MTLLLQLLVNGLAAGCVYALLAIGWSLIYNTTGVLHITHGAIFATGAYSIWFFHIESGWSILPSVLVSVGITATLGVVNYLAVYRPLRQRGSDHLGFFIGSLASAIFLENALAMATNNVPRYLSQGELGGVVRVGEITISHLQILSMCMLVVIGAVYVCLMRWTSLGLRIRAVASNPEMARIVGIRTEVVYLVAFAFGSAVTVPAAFVVGTTLGVTPYLGTLIMFKAAASTFIGGIGSFGGPVAGGVLFGVTENVSLWVLPANWQLIITFSLVLVFMILKPRGLAGRTIRVRELR